MNTCVNNILPLVYNDSITVEEQVQKLTDYINTHIRDYEELENKYQALLEYVKKLEESGFLQVQANWDEQNINNPSYIQNKPSIPSEQVQSNWNETDTESKAFIQNKPSIPAEQVQANWNETNTESKAFIRNKPSIPKNPVQSNWDENDSESLAFIQNKPSIPAEQVQSNWNETDTESKAFIQNKPSIPAEQVQSNWNETDTESKAFIQNKPSIPAEQVQANWNETDTESKSYILNKPIIPQQPVQSDWLDTNPTSLAYIKNKPETAFFEQVQSDWDELRSDSKSFILNKPDVMPNNIAGNFNDLLQASTGYWFIVDKTCANLPEIVSTGNFNEVSVYKSGSTYLCIARGDVSKFFVGYVNKFGETYSIEWQDMSGVSSVDWNGIINKPTSYPFIKTINEGDIKDLEGGYGYMIDYTNLTKITGRPVEHTNGSALVIVNQFQTGHKMFFYYMFVQHLIMIGTNNNNEITWNMAICEDYDKYFKKNETFTPYAQTSFAGFITTSRTYITFSIPLPKSTKKITNINAELLKSPAFAIRSQGVYLFNNGVVGSGGVVNRIECKKSGDYIVVVQIFLDTAVTNSVNNTAIIANGAVKLTFS